MKQINNIIFDSSSTRSTLVINISESGCKKNYNNEHFSWYSFDSAHHMLHVGGKCG